MFRDFTAYNKNIKLAMISSVFRFASNGLLMSALFSIYITAIGGSDVDVGLISFFGGIVLLLVVFPAGFIADHISRKFSLRIGLIVLFIGFVFFFLSLSIYDVYIAFGLINFGNGFIQPSSQALIADSVINNKRDKIYGELFFLQRFSNGLGPLFAIFIFYIIGDNWSASTLRTVIFVGLFGVAIGVIIMFLMDDKYSLGDESESDFGSSAKLEEKFNTKEFIKTNHIPLFVVLLGLVIGIGAGMTVRFFPIFFQTIYLLPPTIVNFIYFLVSAFTGIMGIVVTRVVKTVGKIESIIVVQIIAIISLFIIATVPALTILIPIFLIRGSFMNASQPVKNAIVMDLVKKKYRGVFQSLQVLSQRFFWSFSAGVGGILLSYTSFSVLFITTGTIYIIGTLPFLFLLNRLPNNKFPKKKVPMANITAS